MQRGVLGKSVLFRYYLASTLIIKVHFPQNTDILTYVHDNSSGFLVRSRHDRYHYHYHHSLVILCSRHALDYATVSPETRKN